MLTFSLINTTPTNITTLDIYSKLCHSFNEIVSVPPLLGLMIFLLFCTLLLHLLQYESAS